MRIVYEQFAANLGFSNLSFQVLSFVEAVGKIIVLHQTYFCTKIILHQPSDDRESNSGVGEGCREERVGGETGAREEEEKAH